MLKDNFDDPSLWEPYPWPKDEVETGLQQQPVPGENDEKPSVLSIIGEDVSDQDNLPGQDSILDPYERNTLH